MKKEENNKDVSKEVNNKNSALETEDIPEEMIESFSRFMSISGNINPLANKITEKNISEITELNNKHDERKFKDKRETKIFIIIIFIISVISILFILDKFKNNTDFLKDIIPPVIGFTLGTIGGGLSGYGIGYKRGRNSDE